MIVSCRVGNKIFETLSKTSVTLGSELKKMKKSQKYVFWTWGSMRGFYEYTETLNLMHKRDVRLMYAL